MSELAHHAEQEHEEDDAPPLVDVEDDDAATVPRDQAQHDEVTHDHAHARKELTATATGAHTHVHEHSHGGDEVHAHSHAHVTDEQLHDHDRLHAYVDESTIPVPEEKGPCDRLVTIFEATEVSLDATEICYVGTSGLKVTILDGLDRHKGRLTKLALRSNLVADCKAVASHGATLKHLELYDNRLKSLRGVEHCPFLQVIDVSYNGARDLAQVAVCAQLRELYAACNKLREVYTGLAKLEHLVMLDLGGNRLRSMAHLPPNVEKLFLGKNKIERIENVHALKRLQLLDVQSNRLTALEAGSLPEQLRELYCANNAIEDPPPDALANLCLETVDLSHNRLTSLAVFAGLQLGDLWLSYNSVPSVDAVHCLQGVPLTCLYLDHNPCAAEPRYANYLRDFFPRLEQLDANHAAARGKAGGVS
jgi:protein phosphatase 1 regulatory subunit 7